MVTIKSYTDLKQSKKLAEILPLESADMYYFLDPTPAGNIYHLVVQRVDVGTKNLPEYDKGDVPCWSLAALLGVLPLVDFTTPQLIGTPKTLYRCIYNDNLKSHAYDNPIDACVEMIIYLHEHKML